jgi:hypothetical protein
MPIFDGAAELIQCLQVLVRRPRRREAPRKMAGLSVRRPSPGIPMLCLIRRGDNGALLQALARVLTRARPGSVPHVVYRYPGTDLLLPGSPALAQDRLEVTGAPARHRDADAIMAVLLDLSRGLSSGSNARLGRIRFTRFGLVRWLMNQDLDVDDTDSDTVLRSRMRGRDLARARYSGVFSKRLPELADGVMPKWAQLLQLFPPLWFLVRISGRIPGVGIEYRWLLRQPYLAPLDPGTFLGFAERLSVGKRSKEDPEQVLRLLVHAFLGDVRSAYRRRPWRPRAARRTAYPVVLLDGITRANNGYRLLRLINDVRNETGIFDPLLIITASQTVPPEAGVSGQGPAPERIWSATKARSAYEAWCRHIANDSRARTTTAWYLPIEIPTVLSVDDPSAAARYVSAVQELQAMAPLSVDPAPVWSRPITMALGSATAVAGLLIGGYVVYHHTATVQERHRQEAAAVQHRHCGVSSPEAVNLILEGTECIGITEGGYPFQSVGKMRAVEAKMKESNLTAYRMHVAHRDRPYITLVYVGILTSRDDSEDFADQIATMEGIAAAQAIQLPAQASSQQPIPRILIANAGQSMHYGTKVAAMLNTMKQKDHSIVGVIGLDESRDPTIRTIKELTKYELPMIAPELSADRLSRESRWYFQVSPNNTRQAQVASGWVRMMLARRGSKAHVTLLKSNDTKDKYSGNLADVFARELSVPPRDVRGYKPDSPTDPGDTFGGLTPTQWGKRVCGRSNDVVIFAGRHGDFEDLITEVARQCPDRPPIILGDDDVSRYVAKSAGKNGSGVPFYYVSFAVGPASCRSARPLYRQIEAMFPFEKCPKQGNFSLDGHAALAFDATNTYFTVVQNITTAFKVTHYPLTSAQVMAYIPYTSFGGETGRIDFSNPVPESGGLDSRGVPVNKAVAILGVQNGGQPSLVGRCDGHRLSSPSWCPEDVAAGQR